MSEKKKEESPFKLINTILNGKYEYNEDLYNPFLTHRALSQHIDCIMYANEVNGINGLPKQWSYDYLWHSIRKCKRKFEKWPKKQDDNIIEIIMQYYEVNRKRAEQYRALLTEDQVQDIIATMDQGG